MRWSSLIYFAVCLWLPLSAARGATIPLDHPGNSFVVVPGNGGLCVASTSSDSVSLYPILSKEGVTDGRIDRPVGKGPVSVICRMYDGKPILIVACRDDKTIWVLDAASLAVVKTIDVADAPISLGASMREKSPFVFYGSQSNLGAIDLRTFKDCPNLRANFQGQGAFHELCLSSDGKLIYGKATTWTPTGRIVCSVEDDAAGPPVVKFISYIHDSFTSFRADPFGPYAAYERPGNRGGSEGDPYCALADLPTPVSCFMTTRPLVLSMDQGTLRFYSYNTLKELASTEVSANANPNPMIRNGNRRVFINTNTPAETVLVDEKNNNVLICSESTVKVVELTSVVLPNEPLLGVTAEGSTVFNPGVPGSVTIKKRNPTESVELKDPPTGMKLDGDKITWNPGSADVGDTTVHLRVFSGEFERVQALPLAVRRPEIDLPFAPTHAAISENGKLALVLMTQAGPFQRQGNEPDAELALVDLEKRVVIAQKKLVKPLGAIALDNDHAYGAASDSDAVYAYSLADLSEERKVFASGPVRQMETAAGRLYVATQQGESGVYTWPGFKPLPAPPVDPQMQFRMQTGQWTPMPVRSGDEWIYRGAVYDSALTKVVHLRSVDGFVEVNQPGFNNGMMNNPNQNQPIAWGTMVQGDRVMRLPSQNIGTVKGRSPAFLQDIPALVTLNEDQQQQRQAMQQGPPRVRTSLVFYDLNSVSTQLEIVLSDEPRQINQQYSPFGLQQDILAAPGRLAAVVQDKLYVIETSSLDRSHFPAPPKLEAPPGVQLIDGTKPTVIAFTASNMKAPIEFSLAVDRKEFEIDKSTGKLTIDGKALAVTATETLLQVVSQQRGWQGGVPEKTSPGELVEKYLKTVGPKYTDITGSQPVGVPVVVRLNVIAVDDEQQKTTFDEEAFLNVPKQQLIDRLNKQQTELDANQQQQQQLMAEQQRRFANRRATSEPSADVAELRKELDELKAQMAELQKQNTELAAQNKLLKELVTDKK